MRSSGIPQKLTRYRPHRPRQPKGRKRPAKTAKFYAGDKRSVFTRAVGNDPLAVDNQQQYRPRESPAKLHIMGGAVDAGGISRGSSGETSAVAFSAVQPHRLEVLKAASNAFLTEELALGDVGPMEMARAFKTVPTRIESRQPGLWRQTGERTPATPLPPLETASTWRFVCR